MQFSQPQQNALAQILGGNAMTLHTDDAANEAAGGISQTEREKAAQSRGYRSYNDMIYSMQNRLPPPQVQGQSSAPSQGGIVNVLQALWANPRKALGDAFAWHPASTIGRASDALASVNGE